MTRDSDDQKGHDEQTLEEAIATFYLDYPDSEMTIRELLDRFANHHTVSRRPSERARLNIMRETLRRMSGIESVGITRSKRYRTTTVDNAAIQMKSWACSEALIRELIMQRGSNLGSKINVEISTTTSLVDGLVTTEMTNREVIEEALRLITESSSRDLFDEAVHNTRWPLIDQRVGEVISLGSEGWFSEAPYLVKHTSTFSLTNRTSHFVWRCRHILEHDPKSAAEVLGLTAPLPNGFSASNVVELAVIHLLHTLERRPWSEEQKQR